MLGTREGPIAWIRQVRRLPARDRPSSEERQSQLHRLQALEARVAHLEQLLEGLQDSVHRESERHARLIAQLHNQIQPSAMGAALAEHVRTRGL